ncbi:adenosine deaminase [Fulvimarina manganoxydans]|uniref:adenosine deaminase n=1 Tax=Fulvimarina manganoxydans TaxID=937218 RepID=UPI0023555A42|nr:adenosine deaminase [Fulvimarina manganoxydans]
MTLRLNHPPLAELHCHIEGAAEPALAFEMAERYGVDLSGYISDNGYVWSDFSSFLEAYDAVAACFRTEDDYARLAETYLTALANDGAIYSELFVSPDHARSAGLAPGAYIEGLSRGIERARVTCGIEARMIVVGVRHLGAEAVREAARFAASPRHRTIVTGFGMAGDERFGLIEDYAPAFDIARDAGLGLTVHSGELCGPDQVCRTLKAIRPDRLGHGVRASEDRSLLAEIAKAGIVLEVCPGSNLALGLYPDMARHPLKALVEAGVKVTLNSDDPPFFRTSLAAEYERAAKIGFGQAEQLAFTRTAIEAAFVDEATRKRLLDRLMLQAIGRGAAANPTNGLGADDRQG